MVNFNVSNVEGKMVMKKVAFLINSMAGGGAERVVSVLLKNLSREGRQFYLILLQDKIYYDIPEDIEIIKLNSKFFGWLKLGKIIKENNIDKVISFLGRSNYTNIFAKKTGHKVCISERINPSPMHTFSVTGINGLINRYLVKKLYKKVDSIFTNSLGTMNSLNQDFGIDRNKIKVVYNPLDLGKIKNSCQDDLELEYKEIFKNPVIINVGRLTKQKGQDDLIRSFKIIKKEIPESKLVILGEGELKRKLKRLVKKLGLEENVFFLGWQKNPFKFISQSKVFVLSSLWEGLPNTLMEAMACGTPVVSTDCPSGPDEIIDNNENGILVPLNDQKALMSAITRILKNPAFAKEISQNAKKKVENFSVQKIISQYEKIV